MTIPNIIGAFHTTEIYPFNHHAVNIEAMDSTLTQGLTSLTEKTGLAFIPFYTPMRKSKSAHAIRSDVSTNDDVQDLEFTEEQAQYIRRLQEGYDITSDARYNLWLNKNIIKKIMS